MQDFNLPKQNLYPHKTVHTCCVSCYTH